MSSWDWRLWWTMVALMLASLGLLFFTEPREPPISDVIPVLWLGALAVAGVMTVRALLGRRVEATTRN